MFFSIRARSVLSQSRRCFWWNFRLGQGVRESPWAGLNEVDGRVGTTRLDLVRVVMPEEMKCWVSGAGVVIPALSPKPADEPSAALLRISGDRAHVRHALPRCDQDRHM